MREWETLARKLLPHREFFNNRATDGAMWSPSHGNLPQSRAIETVRTVHDCLLMQYLGVRSRVLRSPAA